MNRKVRGGLALTSCLLVVGLLARTSIRDLALRCYGMWRVAHSPHSALPPLKPASQKAATILAAAKTQIGTRYDASYQTIAYPMGDVKGDRGACTDVVIRALRKAGYDLQELIHDDMTQNWSAYPHQWGLAKPNSDIDHRRVPNQITYFRRHAQALPLDTQGAHLKTWQPGDIVEWNLSQGGKLLHTGIVSDARNAQGEPFVVHNGSVCVEADVLTRWRIIGHFRVPASTSTKPRSTKTHGN